MLGFKCKQAVMQRSHARGHSAKQPSSSSIAHLPSPLMPAARSLRRRVAHQSKDLEEAVLQMCNMLANSKDQAHHTCSCSRFSLGCTPGRTADLADEHEHVERAGLGQVHHEGEVHDAQASAPASNSLGDHARHPLIPPYRCSTKQMTSKLATRAAAAARRSARGPHAPRSLAHVPTCICFHTRELLLMRAQKNRTRAVQERAA